MEEKIIITYPDNRKEEFTKGITGLDIAKKLSPLLSKKILSITINDEVYEITRPIEKDATIRLNTWDDANGKYAFWHSSAHLLAEALRIFFPDMKLGIGPPIKNGFYYDIDLGDKKLDSEIIELIEKKMLELAKQKKIYKRKLISKEKAIEFFTKKEEIYKLELLENLQNDNITLYEHGSFIDLCKGGHIPDTSYIKAVKILNIAGAYWRGDESKKQLTRVYAISFPKKKLLDDYLLKLEEAKKRDHRKIGKELNLFTFSDNVGIGLPLWLPRGTIIQDKLQHFLKKMQMAANYEFVKTPHIGHKNLYITSGHYEKYKNDSFKPIETPNKNEEFLLKPMNCPHHCEIYKSSLKSYKDLPIKLAEFGTVYRYEQHGEILGLARTRGFTQDDAHIFCTTYQVKEQIKEVIDLVLEVFKKFNFNDFKVQLSFRDKKDFTKYIGKEEEWNKAENDILQAAEEKKLKTNIVYGEAAFYGPKIDFMVEDALDREWQLGTVQLDYQLPERFDLTYIDENNKKIRPVIIHRAPFGSLERFIAVLLEHTAGKLPFWLSPEQIRILPISDKFLEYSKKILNLLLKENFIVTLDKRSEKIGKKIRDAEILKIPFMIIIGEKEVSTNMISLKKSGVKENEILDIEKLINKMKILNNNLSQ